MKNLKKSKTLLITLLLTSVLNSCSHQVIEYVPAICRIFLIETHLFSGNINKEGLKEIDRIKTNNEYLCQVCPNYRKKKKCKENKKEMKKIKRRQERLSWWMIWRK